MTKDKIRQRKAILYGLILENKPFMYLKVKKGKKNNPFNSHILGIILDDNLRKNILEQTKTKTNTKYMF